MSDAVNPIENDPKNIKFHELWGARLPKVFEAIRVLDHLASVNYVYSQEDVDHYIGRLQGRVDALRERFEERLNRPISTRGKRRLQPEQPPQTPPTPAPEPAAAPVATPRAKSPAKSKSGKAKAATSKEAAPAAPAGRRLSAAEHAKLPLVGDWASPHAGATRA